MLLLGLTGGIGAGKSTVASMLAERGAIVVDADVIAREVVEPGTDGFREVVEAFGDEVVGPDGSLDRPALGRIVFADDDKRRSLESIIWPRVGLRIAERLQELAPTDAVVVLDIPLLAEADAAGRYGVEEVVVVAADDETKVRRLAERGIDSDDARARIRAQASDDERLAIADHVIGNDGTLDDLQKQVDEIWAKVSEGRGVGA